MLFRKLLHIILNCLVVCVLIKLICILTSHSDDMYRIVDTNSGKIRGVRKTSLLKKTVFYSFKGIPYAKSPIGELRFKAPQPIDPWTPKILNAFEHGPNCIRSNLINFDASSQSEDCLLLNIYVPVGAKRRNKFAVMFWIHGGGFSELSGDDHWFGPDFLIEQQVILVTINYRLGIFGFFSLDTPEYSGNMGLKDQQLALKWVYENIDQFYGDSQRITIFGESAGGSSTHFQVLSSETRKYFRNAIIMSGTAENIWSMSNKNDHIQLARQIAEGSGYSKLSFNDLVEFLKTSPAIKLAQSVAYFDIFFGTLRFKFAPIIEKKDANAPFITDSPGEIYKRDNIEKDIIFYHTSSEMLIFFKDIYANYFDTWEPDTNVTLYLPFRDFDFPPNSTEYRMLENEVRQFYFGNGLIDANTTMPCVDMLSDSNFIYPNYKSMKMHLSHSNGKVFYIQFSVDSALNFLKRKFYALNSNTPGASHSDEICYLFRSDICKFDYDGILANRTNKQSVVCLKTIENITKLFTNFAKYGEPTYKDDLIAGFHSIRNDDIRLLDISNEGLRVISDPRQNANVFWTSLEEKAQKLIDTKNL